MKRFKFLRNVGLALAIIFFTAYQSQAQTFPGPVNITNGQLNLAAGGNPGEVRFNNGSITGGFGGIGSLFMNISANINLQLSARSNLVASAFDGTVTLQGNQGNFAGVSFSDPNNVVQLGVSAFGPRNNFALLESGSYGIINDNNSKWLGLGSAPPGAGGNVFGKRIQWGQNFAIFNLRQASTTDRDLVVQWGGTTANNQLLFEYANGPFSTPTRVMQLESNGNVGIGATPSTTDKLRVNGRIRFGSAEWIEDGGGFQIAVRGTVRPDTDNSRDLGTPTFRWDDVFATNGVIQTSDRRAKKDIKTLSYGLSELMQLKPVTYKWKKDPNKGDQMGLIAQDVQKVISQVVYDPVQDRVMDEEGNMVARENAENLKLGINYTALIPVIINAVQEQQTIIEEQNTKIEKLLGELTALRASLSEQTTGDNQDTGSGDELQNDRARMIQNSPNPFGESTNIEYYLPQSVQKATLYIYNMNGSLVSKHAIEKRGSGAYTLEAKSLTSGIYLYSIVVDGKELGVKRMIIE
ncbi:MAG: tail fiber domain-containing protein [Cyclobacteriaceae bacterium]